MAKRAYIVVGKDSLAAKGVKPLTGGDMVNHALVSAWLDDSDDYTLDSVIVWGYKRESLQAMADVRNADIAHVRGVIERTMLREDASDVPAGEPPADAPKKRGRPRKGVDTETEAC